MSTDTEKIEQLQNYLSACPCDFCIVYQASQVGVVQHGKKQEPIIELKLYVAFSREKRTPGENDELAAKYREAALHCHQNNRNLTLNENLPGENAKTQLWHGLSIRLGSKNPTPANELGQRWWHLFVASGATRTAGYVIVARVAAKEEKELQDHIAKIQRIMGATAAESEE